MNTRKTTVRNTMTPAMILRSALGLVAAFALLQGGALAQGPIAPPVTPVSSLPPGLYVSVIDGAISLANRGGTTNFTAGQFGYTASVTQPPVLVPSNPALKFTPPPTFTTAAATPGSSSAPKSGSVDCEVR